jgi:hypothetical protein
MGLKLRLLGSLVAVAVAFGATSITALAAAPSATGGGSSVFLTSFGFTAETHKDGTVTGNGEFDESPLGLGRFHVRVDCLEVIGTTAYMSGQTTEQTDGLAEGTEMLWGVADNQATGLPALISIVFFSPGPTPFTCHTFHAVPFQPVQGNVEVRPS